MLTALLALTASSLADDGDLAQSTHDALLAEAPEGVTASVAIIRPGSIETVGSQQVYEIGSVSKVFNAWLLATMDAAGDLSLEDRVADLFPVSPRKDADIRLWHLASHSSGLPRLPGNMNLRYLLSNADDPYIGYDHAALEEGLARTKVRGTPGERVVYSNFGAGLLGQILEDAGGSEWDRLLEERVLAPHGLTGIGLLTPPPGYDARGDEVPVWGFDALVGAGGLDADIDAMSRFMQVWLSPDEVMAGMLQVRAEGPPFSAGLGWIQGDRSWWHNGGTAGYASFVGFDPDREVAVVVLLNQGRHGPLTQAGMELLAALE